MTPLTAFFYVAALLVATTGGSFVYAALLALLALLLDTFTRLDADEEDEFEEYEEEPVDIFGGESDAPVSDRITDHEGNPL